MTGRIQNAVRLFLLSQWRCRFPHIYFGTALLTVLVFRLAIPERHAESLIPALLLGEPPSASLA